MPLENYRRIATDIELISKFLELADATVVDLGCGTGELIDRVAQQAALAVGIDIKSTLKRATEERPNTTAQFIAGQAQQLPLAANSVDAVLFIASFHHIPFDEMNVALRETARILRTGGHAFIVEPVAERGSYYELVRLIEDEADVQHQAHLALAEVETHGLTQRHEGFFYFERTVQDFNRLVELFVETPQQRSAVLEEAGKRLADLAAVASRSPEAMTFKSTCRLNLLQRSS